MAMSSIDVARTKQYSNIIYSLSQQRFSHFGFRVRREMIVGAKAKSFNRLGDADSQSEDTRHRETPLNEQPLSRRWVSATKTDSGALLDEQDELNILIEPKNKYAMHQEWELSRKTDDKIIAAALGTAVAGEDQGTSVTFADDSVSINGDGTATTLGTAATAAGAGSVADISLAKMLLMLQLFNQEDVDPAIPRYWGVSAKTASDILNITEYKDVDFNRVKPLVEGKLVTFAGFTWFWSNRITKDAASETAYRSIAWAEDGIILGIQKDIATRVSERDDLCYSQQIYSAVYNGAVRMEGAKVHECMNKVD